MAIGIGSVTLVYNTDKIKQPITSWSDLWKPEFKGHVIIPSIPNAYGINLLVMAAKASGGDEKKIDSGFAKLRDLAPSVAAVYESSSHAAQLFQMGGAWIAPWFAGRVPSTQAAGIPVAAADLKEGQVAYLTVVSPLKGKYSKDVALFLNLYLSDEAAQGFAKGIGYGPVRRSVKLPEDVAKTVPYGEEQVTRLKHLDWTTIVENRVRWAQRFQREIVPLIGQK
jgi:putative spermidine/putrescine transport system substrate-binding protein